MVRVISEKLFSPPRSRHSSGETVDKELAARAVEVLSSLNSRRLELSDYESSSDSHWDSEVDVEGDGADGSASRSLSVGEGKNGQTTDVLRKRKERRRERNKLSAQAYRVRRKEQTAKQQTVLKVLQEENTRLKSTVQNLEDELQKVRNSLRQLYPSTFTLASATPTPAPAPTPNTCTESGPGNAGPSRDACGKVSSFSPLSEESTANAQPGPMDNDHSRRQQISPVVDNFLFSKPLPTCPSSGAMNVPSVTPTFSFPTTSPAVGARHNFGAASFLTTPLPTISEKPDGPFGHHQHHPHPTTQLHQQHADLNANAHHTFALANANTINANANTFGAYKNSNCMNNNNVYQSPLPMNGEPVGCASIGPQRASIKACKV